MPRTLYEKIANFLSSRRVTAIFLLFYTIRLALFKILVDKFWIITVMTLPLYLIVFAVLTAYLFKARKRIFAIFFILLFLLIPILTIEIYSQVDTYREQNIIFPRIEQVSLELLAECGGDYHEITLSPLDAFLSIDGMAIVRGDTVWFLERISPLDGDNYYVYDATGDHAGNPFYSKRAEHIYYYNEN